MKYAVDKIEGNIVTLESLDTKEKKEVLLEVLPSSIKEGTILTVAREAVEYAVKNAQSGDIVILAGKGQETTQQVRGRSVAYIGDMQKAKEILA